GSVPGGAAGGACEPVPVPGPKLAGASRSGCVPTSLPGPVTYQAVAPTTTRSSTASNQGHQREPCLLSMSISAIVPAPARLAFDDDLLALDANAHLVVALANGGFGLRARGRLGLRLPGLS